MRKCKVVISRFAEKQFNKLPEAIRERVRTWIETVEFIGVIEIRKYPGLHDEPLKGDRQGQRSVRLNRAYRLIYVETLTEEICIIGVKEIHKHDY